MDALVEAVRLIVTEPGKLQAMGQAARVHAERQSWPHMMDELVSCYEAILAGQPPPI